MVFFKPFKRKWSRMLWYILVTIVSMMVGTGIAVKTLFCYYAIEPIQACTVEARPVANATYTILYILLGPLLALTIFRNDLRFQLVGVIIMLSLVIWAIVVTVPLDVA